MEIALFLQGVLLMASLIIGMGPQNLHVFRCACSGQATIQVVTICLLGDIGIMLAGVLLFSSLDSLSAELQAAVQISTVVLLCAYGLQSFKRARSSKSTEPAVQMIEGRAILLALVLTFLNPAVYIDSFFLIGLQANQAAGELRWYFLLGAMFCSLCWYPGLALSGVLFSKKWGRKSSHLVDYLAAAVLFMSAAWMLYL